MSRKYEQLREPIEMSDEQREAAHKFREHVRGGWRVPIKVAKPWKSERYISNAKGTTARSENATGSNRPSHGYGTAAMNTKRCKGDEGQRRA
jgi:hypothetical protein